MTFKMFYKKSYIFFRAAGLRDPACQLHGGLFWILFDDFVKDFSLIFLEQLGLRDPACQLQGRFV